MATLRNAKYRLLDISIQYYISEISVLTRVLQWFIPVSVVHFQSLVNGHVYPEIAFASAR